MKDRLSDWGESGTLHPVDDGNGGFVLLNDNDYRMWRKEIAMKKVPEFVSKAEERRYKRAMAEKCSICHQPIVDYGHNAWPINNGRCCDACNSFRVIPARITKIVGE